MVVSHRAVSQDDSQRLSLSERAGQELAQTLGPWIGEQLRRSPLLLHLAAMEKEDLVLHLARKLHLVRHQDHGVAVIRELADDAQHLAHQLGIER